MPGEPRHIDQMRALGVTSRTSFSIRSHFHSGRKQTSSTLQHEVKGDFQLHNIEIKQELQYVIEFLAIVLGTR